MKTLIIYKNSDHRAFSLAGELKAQLQLRNISSVTLASNKLAQLSLDHYNIVFVLGGDGTILRVARHLAGTDIPILSVNFGRIGFLSSAEPCDMADVLHKIENRQFHLVKRLMLDIQINRGQNDDCLGLALNDAVIRSHVIHPINICLRINGRQFAQYMGDGVICATPTGSTAYSYSAGGPIVDACAKVLTITPINSQLSCCRPIVLDANSKLDFEIVSKQPTVLSIDGQEEIELFKGDVIKVIRSGKTVTLVQFEQICYVEKILRSLIKPFKV